MSERKMVVLDWALEEHLGKEHWRGEAWAYADELPPQMLVRYEPLDIDTFTREIALLAEHFNKNNLSEPLLERYFEILNKKLNKERFLAAVEAAYSTDLYWNQVIPFLATHHEQQQVAGAQAYQLYDEAAAKNLLTGLDIKPRKA